MQEALGSFRASCPWAEDHKAPSDREALGLSLASLLTSRRPGSEPSETENASYQRDLRLRLVPAGTYAYRTPADLQYLSARMDRPAVCNYRLS